MITFFIVQGVKNYELRVGNYELRDTNYELGVVGYGLFLFIVRGIKAGFSRDAKSGIRV